jgi:hypothetical protein
MGIALRLLEIAVTGAPESAFDSVQIVVGIDAGFGQCSSKFGKHVNRLPLATQLTPSHFASSLDKSRVLKFLENWSQFICHIPNPQVSVVGHLVLVRMAD